MMVNDLCILKRSLYNKFADMPCPRNDVHSYWCVARDFPHEWGQLVRQLNDLDDEFATMGEQAESSNAPSALRLIISCFACAIL